MNKIKYIAAVLIAVAGLGLQQARADTFTSYLNAGNTAIGGYTGPYGTVTVDLVNSTTATITFTSNTVGGNIYLFGDGGSVAVNVNGTFTVGTITGTHLPGFGFHTGEGYTADLSNGNQDGFGSFNLAINSSDGYTRSSNSITFTLTATGTTTWASAADVLIANADGFDAAAHIFVSDGNAAHSALATGFAAETGGHIVPDGGTTVMLLGAALSGLGLVRRFLKR